MSPTPTRQSSPLAMNTASRPQTAAAITTPAMVGPMTRMASAPIWARTTALESFGPSTSSVM